MNFQKVDAYDQPLNPGDVCVHISAAREIEFVVYKGTTYGGKRSKGEFGKFITAQGVKTLRYRNVVFITDPMASTLPYNRMYNNLVKEYYEGAK